MQSQTRRGLISPRGLFAVAALCLPAWSAILLALMLAGVPAATFAGVLLATWAALIALGTALELRRDEP